MKSLYDQIQDIPLYDTHMHASSLSSVGAKRADGFETDITPACPAGETTLITLLCAPYMLGNHMATGLYHPSETEDFASQWAALQPALAVERGTGLFIALDTALQDLYGISLSRVMREGVATAQTLSHMIAARYAKGLFAWSAQAMRRARIVHALKPVHAAYIKRVSEGDVSPEYSLERSMYTPIFRTDDLFGRLDAENRLIFPQLEEGLGIRIHSLAALEQAIDALYTYIQRVGSPCVKQAQAYLRPITFEKRTRAEAKAAFSAALAGDADAARIVQDYVMENILSRGMTYQIHTGVANLGNTSPVLLRGAIERHPKVKFVLLHGYPHLSEAINLVRFYQNVYLDFSWLQLLSPTVQAAALREAIGFVPMNKIFLSTDATSPEEQYGAAVGMRKVLAIVLEEKMSGDGWDEGLAMDAAHALLHGNAECFYGKVLGELP
ncbi:MAG: amidohydrolase family protein [Christensenellales bacterium]|jgi:glucuronate isomerase